MSTPPMETVAPVQANEVAALQDVSLRLMRKLRKHSHTDLTMSQISALASIQRNGPMRVGELARREQISKSSVTRLVAKLQEMDYLERRVDPDDGRSFVIDVTDHGRELLAASRERGNEFLAHQVGRLSEDDRVAILAALPSLERLIALS